MALSFARPDTFRNGTGAPLLWAALAYGQVLTAFLLLVLSPMGLVALNWQYADTGGSALEKFHPSTLIAMLLTGMLAVAAAGNPLTGLARLIAPLPGLWPYFAANVAMVAYAAVVVKLPVTIFIETFIGAGLMLLVFQWGGETRKHRLALLIHAILAANAVLAFFEGATGFRLTPLVVNGELLTDEPRSTALLGHPLSNAMLMACYVIVLALGGGRDLPRILRPAAFLLAFASLIPFGGRAGTATCLAAIVLIALAKGWAVVRGGRFDTRTVIALLLVGPTAAFGLVAAYELGAFDTLTNRLFDDDGSAGTRIEMFQLFNYLSLGDLLFGPDPEVLGTYVRMHGLEYGIESFIIAFILNYGVLPATVFMPAFALFLREIVRVTRPAALVVIAAFLVIALTSISLSSKAPALSVFVMMVTVLLRPALAEDGWAHDAPLDDA